MSKRAMPDVVVVLPGITGSVLQRDGKDVWAFSPSAIARGLFSGLGSLRRLELTDDDWTVDDLGDGVTADRVVPDLHLIPGLWKIDGYGVLVKTLQREFALEEGRNFFTFPYDWRRDNRASARALQRRAHEWLQAWRTSSGNAEAKLILVGHSMGGLVSRYFVEALGGWRDTRAVVTFGTPFYGSMNAIEFLVHGMRKGIGPIGVDLSPLLRSFTSVQQLVPIYRCVHDRAGNQVRPTDADLPGWQPRWSSPLLDFHTEVEQAATDNRAEAAWEREGTAYLPIVGTDQPTSQSVRVTADGIEVLASLNDEDDGGDGTVPRLSAALSGTERSTMYSPQQHARIQNYASVLEHLRGLLTGMHLKRIDDLRGRDQRRQVAFRLAYDGEDLYDAGEPITFRAALRSDADEHQVGELKAEATLTSQETGATVESRPVTLERDLRAVFELAPPPPGVYTIELTAPGAAPVSDVFAVLETETAS
jgi:pimeloyl-ACP methyl ester carboxylesterase